MRSAIYLGTTLLILAFATSGCGDDERQRSSSRTPESSASQGDCDLATDPECPQDCWYESQWPEEMLAEAEEAVRLMNELRAAGTTCGGESAPAAGPLTIDPYLARASRCHSVDMAEHETLTHTGSDGSSFSQRATAAGYTAAPRAENAGMGYGDAAAMVDGWHTSPGHCRNMMNGGYNEVGVGIAYTENNRPYWTAKFGFRSQ